MTSIPSKHVYGPATYVAVPTKNAIPLALNFETDRRFLSFSRTTVRVILRGRLESFASKKLAGPLGSAVDSNLNQSFLDLIDVTRWHRAFV